MWDACAWGCCGWLWVVPDTFCCVCAACAGFSWKGQTAAITQLLVVLISQAADPSQEVLSLVADALSSMPDKVPAKEQLDPVAGFAALCSATFATWYK